MNIIFYQFAKRSNSTKIVDVTGTTLSCELKESVTMYNPGLVIKAVPAGWSPIWNYCYIAAFNRYYFINNWNWLNGVWECSCVCDVLASFKTEIGNLSEYVLRSSNVYNDQVVDLQYPTTAETRVDATQLTNRFKTVYGTGYYILGVISNDSSSAQGAVTYYQMSAAQLAAMKAYLMSDYFLTDQSLDITTVTDVIPEELLKTLYDPYKYIASCIWMPFDITAIGNSLKTLSSIAFGWFSPTGSGTSVQGYKINANGYVATFSERISIAGHPQRFNRGVFLDHAPFADRMLFYPPLGSIPLNDDSIIGGDFIRVELTVDMVLGDAVLSVYHDRPLDEHGNYRDMGVLARVSSPVGVPIQLAQTSIDVQGSVSAVSTMAISGTVNAFIGSAMRTGFNSIGGVLETLGDTLTGAGESTISAIGDVIQNPVGQLQTSGSNGSLAQYCTMPYLVEKWRIVADDDNAQKGRPLCQVKTLNTIAGYIMVDTPDVSIACLEVERQQISGFLSSGFFYE